LHVVRGEDVGHTSEFVEKAVFEAEERGWSDDSGLGEDAASHGFSSSLGFEKLGWRVDIRIVGRDVDESVHVVFGNNFSNPLNALYMHILKIKVLGWVFSANEIVDYIRVSNALLE
jgi:hypothetical protein